MRGVIRVIGNQAACIGIATALAVLVVGSLPAFADVDITGIWDNRDHQDQVERLPGPLLVDYTGLPLNEAGRERALQFDYSLLSEFEHQCGYYTPFYEVLGPFGNNIWTETDPITGRILAYKIGAWIDKDIITIWMDGRPHPSKSAMHTYAGFTTGEWVGDTLVTYTTHMKDGYLRRNGVPSSDQATMAMQITRHGELLTITASLTDPIYLAEPYIYAQVWKLDPRLALARVPSGCETSSENPRMDVPGVVPHYLPGKNPFVNEFREMYNLPLEAVLGGPETRNPEFRKKLKGYVPPAKCPRDCGGGGLGAPPPAAPAPPGPRANGAPPPPAR